VINDSIADEQHEVSSFVNLEEKYADDSSTDHVVPETPLNSVVMPSYHTPFILVSVSDTILGSESSSLRVVVSLFGTYIIPLEEQSRDNSTDPSLFHRRRGLSTYISSQLSLT
jgi:hypothetical protein